MANLRRASQLATQGADELSHGELDYGKTNTKRFDEDDEDEGGFDEDDTALDAGDYGNFWEGMLEKQGKAMLNKKWRQRWCSIKGSRFEYFEDHTKAKSLGVVPLEMCTWTHNNPKAPNQIELKTIGREAKSGEKEGRLFFFRFLSDSDREGFVSSLARAAYLRNREVFLEACRLGDAFTVHQVMMRMRIMEGSEDTSMGRAVMSGGATMVVCRPVAFCSDYDPSKNFAGMDEATQALQLAASVELGTPGILEPTALDLLLHEAHVNEQASPLHLALKSCDVASWGDPKEYQAAAAAAAVSSLKGPTAAALPLSSLAGHGPHPLACAKLLLKPLWVESGANALELCDPLAPFEPDLALTFLLETIDACGETPLMACLRCNPFRPAVDALPEAAHTARRLQSALPTAQQRKDAPPPFYEVDPRSFLLSTARGGGGGKNKDPAGGELGWGSGGLACAAVLLQFCSEAQRCGAVNDEGLSALHLASSVPELTPLLGPLLVLGPVGTACDLEAQDGHGCTSLMHAAKANNVAGAQALLALKANLRTKSWKNGYSALSWAVRCASDSVCTLLLNLERQQRTAASAPTLLKAAHSASSPVLTPTGTGAAPPAMLKGAVTGVVEVENEESGWLDEEDAAFMASAPAAAAAGSSSEKTKANRDEEGGDGTDGEDDDDGDNSDDDDDENDSALQPPRASELALSLACVEDSRGDVALHLLARAYVAKSRESQRMKNATLGQFKTVLELLLCDHGKNSAAGAGQSGGALGTVNKVGFDGRTPLLIMARAEAEPVNIALVMQAFDVLLEQGAADVKATTPGGHTPLHLAADVGNHALCKALVLRGADPNAQSLDGVTAYGYVKKRLQAAAAGGSSSSGAGAVGGGGMAGVGGGGSVLQATRMLQRTADVLLECGAYKLERSEVCIDSDSATAQWMKGSDGSLQLKAATAPQLVSYLCRSTTPQTDLDAMSWQFHRTLRDDKDPFAALAVLLRLLKQTYESVASGEANSVNGTVAIHVGVWRVVDRLLAERPELFPHPTSSVTSSAASSAAAAAAGVRPQQQDHGGDDDEGDDDEGGDEDEYAGHFADPSVAPVDGADGSGCTQSEREAKVLAVRRALRDLCAATVRSGLPDAFGLITYKKPLACCPNVYRYARKAARTLSSNDQDNSALGGDPIWMAFLSRNPLAHVAPLGAGQCSLVSPAAAHPAYHTLARVVATALGNPHALLSAHHQQQQQQQKQGSGVAGGFSMASPSMFLRSTPPSAAEREKGLLAFSPQQIGQHLTVVVHLLFCHVPVREFCDKRYARGRANSPRFHLLKDFVNRVQYNLISECVRRADLKDRSSVLALLVRSAEACLQLNNYDGAMLLVGVLCDSAVHRLRKTWDMVEQLIPKHWEAVQHAVGMAGRSLEQTMAQLSADPPAMPAVGFLIKNLVNLEEREEFIRATPRANPALAAASSAAAEPGAPAPPAPPPPPALVNFERVRSVGAVLELVRSCQRVPYPFADKCNPGLLSLLLAPPQFADEEGTYEQSLRVEARVKPAGKK